MSKVKKSAVNLDFLLEHDVQFENRVSPTAEAKKRFQMIDDNHRQVSRERVLEIFWSRRPKEDRPPSLD